MTDVTKANEKNHQSLSLIFPLLQQLMLLTALLKQHNVVCAIKKKDKIILDKKTNLNYIFFFFLNIQPA